VDGTFNVDCIQQGPQVRGGVEKVYPRLHTGTEKKSLSKTPQASYAQNTAERKRSSRKKLRTKVEFFRRHDFKYVISGSVAHKLTETQAQKICEGRFVSSIMVAFISQAADRTRMPAHEENNPRFHDP
jgi:hypothetical protein